MEYRVLGPLEVSCAAAPVHLGGPKARAVLAALVLHPNEVVSVDRLVETVWGEDPPRTAIHSLQVYVSDLRKVIPSNGDGIRTVAPGYMLEVDEESIDAIRFEHLVAEARGVLAAGGAEEAAAQLSSALALWRGPPLPEFAYDEFAQEAIRHLEELYSLARELRYEAELACGRQREILLELEDDVAAYPLREKLRRDLMIALCREGRAAEALSCYEDYRCRLHEGSDLEPGADLTKLAEAIRGRDCATDRA